MDMPTDRPYHLAALEVQENFFNITGLAVHLANGQHSPIFKGRQLGTDSSKQYNVKTDKRLGLIILKNKQ